MASFAQQLCICGKPGDKRCGRCKMKSYCSRECQSADYSKHKEWCKMMTYQMNSGSCATALNCAGTLLPHLPSLLATKPFAPQPPLSNPVLPLEQFVPWFMVLGTANLQFGLVPTIAPLIAVVRRGNHFTGITLNPLSGNMPKTQTFIPFSAFNGTKVLPAALRSDPEDMKAIYLMISLSSKCTQFVSAFSLLIQKITHTHRMTYQGERVIGWGIQDGNLDTKHPNCCALKMVSVRNPADAVKVVECVKDNRPLPKNSADRLDLGSHSTHVWLNFVTESGRMFDLDLSSWQFGPLFPFPCILPIDVKSSSTLSTTLNGMCKRDRLMSITMNELKLCIDELMDNHVTMVRGFANGNSDLTLDSFKSLLENVGTAAMNPIALEKEMPNFENPYYFWNRLRSL